MNYILFDDKKRESFFPLSLTNTLADMLIGRYTNRDRWNHSLNSTVSNLTAKNLKYKFPLQIENDNILINTRVLPNAELIKEIVQLEENTKLIQDDVILAVHLDSERLQKFVDEVDSNDNVDFPDFIEKIDVRAHRTEYRVKTFDHLWDFFLMNGEVMLEDLKLMDLGDYQRDGGIANTCIGSQIYIHKNAKVNASILNSESGPIIIEEGAEVMEGSIIRGPFYLGKHSSVKMGAKIYGPTSVGDHCKVGGEINNSVVNSYSNKGHDGFIGNTVIGQWCNLGADTNTSNLKNDYSIVKLWNYEKQSFVRSGLQFLGLVMGDHSKCGINTMFNTGTVVGVFCNVYGAGFQPNFIPSFSWGKPGAFTEYQFEKALQVAQRVMERRNTSLDSVDEKLLKNVFDSTKEMRNKFH